MSHFHSLPTVELGRARFTTLRSGETSFAIPNPHNSDSTQNRKPIILHVSLYLRHGYAVNLIAEQETNPLNPHHQIVDWDRQRHSILSIGEELQTFDGTQFSSNFCEPPTYSTPLKPQGRLGDDYLAAPPSLGEEHPELLLSARDAVRRRLHREDPRLLLEQLGSGKKTL
ncbi:BTB/POZ domain-containing protein [Pyrus ussuriensis x Pyrus communis]|uniref:BTB/POZ domain-containing protein n=1 Tax=Pyrus ussuriensis x Pyrus communis TaxID=2448454 RepID=A0A5N5HRJ5_9ROSA|nr:BTB/POZ domain-containing protein [Pyrus ussuriensis x Pyrus communis]